MVFADLRQEFESTLCIHILYMSNVFYAQNQILLIYYVILHKAIIYTFHKCPRCSK